MSPATQHRVACRPGSCFSGSSETSVVLPSCQTWQMDTENMHQQTSLVLFPGRNVNRLVLHFADRGDTAPSVLHRLKHLEETSQEGSMQDPS